MSAARDLIRLDDLRVLVGEWEVEFIDGDVIQCARTNFEWHHDQYMVQTIGPPEAQEMVAFMALNQERQVFEQFHFDPSGVVLVYEMTLCHDVWTMSRSDIEFLPLDFAERFIGRFTDDGNSIHARWEVSPDGRSWQPDFEMVYRKLLL